MGGWGKGGSMYKSLLTNDQGKENTEKGSEIQKNNVSMYNKRSTQENIVNRTVYIIYFMSVFR